jgi:hypothetical protein
VNCFLLSNAKGGNSVAGAMISSLGIERTWVWNYLGLLGNVHAALEARDYYLLASFDSQALK